MWHLDRGRGGTVTGCENSAFIGLSSQTDVQKGSQKVRQSKREGQLCILGGRLGEGQEYGND